jgi:hypothetical protein
MFISFSFYPSFRGAPGGSRDARPDGASPESILMVVVMDSGFARQATKSGFAILRRARAPE